MSEAQKMIDEMSENESLRASCHSFDLQVADLTRQVEDLKLRNQILRTRPDLPMTDPQKAMYKQLEQQVEALTSEIVRLKNV